MRTLSIGQWVEVFGGKLALKVEAGHKGLDRLITSSEIHRPMGALTGFVGLFTFDRVQVLGNTEILFLDGLSEQARREALEVIYQFDIPCVVITDDNRSSPVMRDLADQKGIPLLQTRFSTTKFAHLFSLYMDDFFAPQTTLHGSLVDVNGIGLLFIGKSAIGKSEVALDLVERGHRLVADDVVIVSRKTQGILVGTSPEMLRTFLEIRGLGILDVRNMFGIRAFRIQKRIEIVVKLVEWDDSLDYERTGLEDHYASIMDVEIPLVTVPIYPGKNITVIAEAIALNHQLKLQGYHTAQEFNRRQMEYMKKKRPSDVQIRVDVE
ncbi:MAG: HPr(Ser) kinase/phosphatase [Candidatus Handelsmanbacteria bacterium RIFCSPLOWO2_12_FULL_64_10]|uniref:HPr kinase/phosphorylase n=1 Tax=Handelsmanbacteria sp. (strain RIFCSPLOWO2_12_FULL_64_10) TaxID=1817868 RepID=A0A1F6CR80_HANXR|nr:MAG: HPr(Ser) kinase/phosphatase [Candidatus Handelsmanbacteria bacterium RIFCSPLOWO2_12_FULL_64_10]